MNILAGNEPAAKGAAGQDDAARKMTQKQLDDIEKTAAVIARERKRLEQLIIAAALSGETHRGIAKRAGIRHQRVGELVRAWKREHPDE